MRVSLVLVAVGLLLAASSPPADAAVPVRVERLAGFAAPGTPARFNQVGVLQIGPRSARNILVLNPGTSASAAYFGPVAKSLVQRAKGWQVWAVERRENLLEDHSVLDRAKQGKATPRQLFDYYLGWISNPSVQPHFKLIPDASVAYARGWGMRVEIEDLRRVVTAARHGGRTVVLGGHSLGGSMTTAYATWDFDGRPGARGLAGLVYIDGGSRPSAVGAADARAALRRLQAGSPWLSFGGIAAPFAGLFQSGGSTLALIDPDGLSLGQASGLLPAALVAPFPVTNRAQFGFALDTQTSPDNLAAAQAHLGQLAATGSPRGWEDAGELTPIDRYAEMFSGTGLKGLDGTAWYHPLRLTIDAGAVANGNGNDAQRVLDVRATHGGDLPKGLRIYAFAAALGGPGVLDAARLLARQSHVPRRNLTLVDRHTTYAHNDPAGAAPRRNAFLQTLVPFLTRVARVTRRSVG
jgi:hypothetical protein